LLIGTIAVRPVRTACGSSLTIVGPIAALSVLWLVAPLLTFGIISGTIATGALLSVAAAVAVVAVAVLTLLAVAATIIL